MDIPLMLQTLSKCAQPQRDVAIFLVIATCDDLNATRDAFKKLNHEQRRALWATHKRVQDLIGGKE